MLVLRATQVEALREFSIDRFVARVAAELRRQFAATLKETTDPQLVQSVRTAVAKSRDYGVVEEADVKRYAEYVLEYGPEFDRNPWATGILTDAKTGSEKMDDLDSYSTFELRP